MEQLKTNFANNDNDDDDNNNSNNNNNKYNNNLIYKAVYGCNFRGANW